MEVLLNKTRIEENILIIEIFTQSYACLSINVNLFIDGQMAQDHPINVLEGENIFELKLTVTKDNQCKSGNLVVIEQNSNEAYSIGYFRLPLFQDINIVGSIKAQKESVLSKILVIDNKYIQEIMREFNHKKDSLFLI
jgi:hypothetical protein